MVKRSRKGGEKIQGRYKTSKVVKAQEGKQLKGTNM